MSLILLKYQGWQEKPEIRKSGSADLLIGVSEAQTWRSVLLKVKALRVRVGVH